MTGTAFGTEYHDEDWPHGLSCPRCGRVLQEGDHYSEELEAFQGEIPIVLIVCVACAFGSPPPNPDRSPD